MRNNNPVRLEKKETPTKISEIINRNQIFLMGLVIGLLMTLFFVLAVWFVGVSATDSGTVYNNMSRWI